MLPEKVAAPKGYPSRRMFLCLEGDVFVKFEQVQDGFINTGEKWIIDQSLSVDSAPDDLPEDMTLIFSDEHASFVFLRRQA